MKDCPNINALWGTLLVEELTRQGVGHFVIAPGSRSTPLVIAVARNESARAHIVVDERAAGYFALGLARATGRPAAVITTSGTAVANLMPAVVEASVDRVPMLLLTADRPPELRDCGANQAIRQTSMFAAELRWHFDVPPPDDRVPARMVLTAAAHACFRSQSDAGPVQLNCMFREPLAPKPQDWDAACMDGLDGWLESRAPFTSYGNTPIFADDDVDRVKHLLSSTATGLVVVAGHRPVPSAVMLATKLGWPLWADVRSGVRLSNPAPCHMPHIDLLIAAGIFRPAAILQLGGRATSKQLLQFLDDEHVAPFIVVDASRDRLDPNHRATVRVVADPDAFCRELSERAARPATQESRALAPANQRVEEALQSAIDGDAELSEPFVARWITAHAPSDHRLFVSSSMPIRDLQRFAVRDGPRIGVAANRGASGIDGVVATAAGYATGSASRTTLLIGDLALLHDLGSLALLANLDEPVIVVALNNGGGSIFTMLPIAEHGEVFSPYFDTPHELGFAGVANDFGIAYRDAATRAEFEDGYRAALERKGPTLLEVRSSLAANKRHHERLESVLRAARDE